MGGICLNTRSSPAFVPTTVQAEGLLRPNVTPSVAQNCFFLWLHGIQTQQNAVGHTTTKSGIDRSPSKKGKSRSALLSLR